SLLMSVHLACWDAIMLTRSLQDVARLFEEDKIGVLLVTHDLEEALALSDHIYLLSQGPRARIIRDYPVPLPRPRNPVRARMDPAFAPLYEKLWNDLSLAVDGARAEAAE